jgi:hypothetical protein
MMDNERICIQLLQELFENVEKVIKIIRNYCHLIGRQQKSEYKNYVTSPQRRFEHEESPQKKL